MSMATSNTALQAWFVTKWAAAGYTAAEVKLDNIDFTPPTATHTWVGFYVRETAEQARELGVSNVNHKHTGLVTVQFFARIGTGKLALDTLMVAVTGWLRGAPVAGTYFTEQPFSVFGGGLTADGWYSETINFPYHRDEQHTLNNN